MDNYTVVIQKIRLLSTIEDKPVDNYIGVVTSIEDYDFIS